MLQRSLQTIRTGALKNDFPAQCRAFALNRRVSGWVLSFFTSFLKKDCKKLDKGGMDVVYLYHQQRNYSQSKQKTWWLKNAHLPDVKTKQ